MQELESPTTRINRTTPQTMTSIESIDLENKALTNKELESIVLTNQEQETLVNIELVIVNNENRARTSQRANKRKYNNSFIKEYNETSIVVGL